MIYCHKCKTQNISNATRCSKCGTNLLPGATFGERIAILGFSIVVGVIFAGLTYAFVFYFRISYLVAVLGWGIIKSVIVYIAIILVGVFSTLCAIRLGISEAFKKTPAHERYFERAKRHIELDPKQSIEDYSMALKLLPAEPIQIKMQSSVNKFKILYERALIFNKLDMANEAIQDWQASLFEVNKLLSSSTKSNKGELLFKRANIYEKLGMKDESILDRLNYTYAEEQVSFKSKRLELVKLRTELITELMSDSRFKAVGYCSECKTLVNLDSYLKCFVSPEHSTRDVHFIIIKDEYNIGDTGPAGGLIFYVNPNYITDGWRYLEAAPSDQSTKIQWYNGSVKTGATATAVGTGQANTQTIVNIHGAGSYAAQLCNDLTLGGYSDCFLPSKDELNEMYINLYLKGLGGFTSGIYWSSSETNAYYAWAQNFTTGHQGSCPKASARWVRAARAF